MLTSLVGINPKKILLHGPTKALIDQYLWHDPQKGIVASYTPTANDVKDHFGIFRGVDQIEAFAQATAGSCSTFIRNYTHPDFPFIEQGVIPAFISIGSVHFHSYLKEGETFISVGQIKFYKFRQIVVDGRIYKVPKNINLVEYFKNFSSEKLFTYELSDDFTLIAELFDITGRAIKNKL